MPLPTRSHFHRHGCNQRAVAQWANDNYLEVVFVEENCSSIIVRRSNILDDHEIKSSEFLPTL